MADKKQKNTRRPRQTPAKKVITSIGDIQAEIISQEIVEIVTPELQSASPGIEVKAPDKQQPEPEERSRSIKQIILICLGGLILAAAGYAVYYWLNYAAKNPYLGMAAVIALAGGGYLVYSQLNLDGNRAVNVTGGKPGYTGKENSLNIYAVKDELTGKIYPDKILFEYVEHPLGQPQRCVNNSKNYYVHMWDIEHKRLIPFIPPDAEYSDPALLARYLELPAQRRYLRHRDSLLKYVGAGLLALAVGGGFIAIIAMSG